MTAARRLNGRNKSRCCCCYFFQRYDTICLDPMQELLPLPQPEAPERVVRIEKNLNSLGFFSPTASTGKRRNEKVISYARELPGGIKAEARATIMATSRGLPNTADLDKYLAFQLIVSEIKKKQGLLTNPISFTTYQLLLLLGLKPTGKRYAEVDHWLDRMAGTLIKSEGAVFFAKTKRYMKDRFHVFEKVYTVGEELPDGRKAEQNYVFLSDWQLDNLNHGYVLPIALEHYQQLRTDIAKNLVPMFYIWFYASSRRFQKRYRDLCQHLNVKVWTQFSRAKEQFSPALSELQEIGYLADWDLCRTLDGTDFKLVFEAGPIFRDETKAGRLRQRDDTAADQRFHLALDALTARGVTEKAARRLLFAVPDDIDVQEQIFWIDTVINRDPLKFENPAGLYVSLIRDGILPPSNFVSSHRRKEAGAVTRSSDTGDPAAAAKSIDTDLRYLDYCEEQVKGYIAKLPAEASAKLAKEARKAAARHISHFDALTPEQASDLTSRFVFSIVASEIPLVTREEFCTREQFQQLSLGSSEGR